VTRRSLPDLTNAQVKKLAKANFLGAFFIIFNALAWGNVYFYFGYYWLALFSFSYSSLAWRILVLNEKGQFTRSTMVLLVGLAMWLVVIALTVSGPGIGYGGAVHYNFLVLAIISHAISDVLGRAIKWCISLTLVSFYVFFHLPVVEFIPLFQLSTTQKISAEAATVVSGAITVLVMLWWLRKDFIFLEKTLSYSNENAVELLKQVYNEETVNEIVSDGRLVVKSFPCSAWLAFEITNYRWLLSKYSLTQLSFYLNPLFEKWEATIEGEGERILKHPYSFSVIFTGHEEQALQTQKAIRLAHLISEDLNLFSDMTVRVHVYSGALCALLLQEYQAIQTFWGDIVERESAVTTDTIRNSLVIDPLTYYSLTGIKDAPAFSFRPLPQRNLYFCSLPYVKNGQ